MSQFRGRLKSAGKRSRNKYYDWSVYISDSMGDFHPNSKNFQNTDRRFSDVQEKLGFQFLFTFYANKNRTSIKQHLIKVLILYFIIEQQPETVVLT